jgi:MATE family multidrug resistance protein
MKIFSRYFNLNIISQNSKKIVIPRLDRWIYSISSFVATIMTAHLGKESLAAIALAIAIWNFLIATFMGILSAVGILIAQQYGANNKEAIRVIFVQGIWVAILCSLFIVAVLWIVTPLLCQWSGLGSSVTQLTIATTHTISIGILPVCLLVVAEKLFISLQRSKLVLWITASFVPFEIIFNYLIMFGKFGFPKLGVVGTGYTFAATFTIGASIFAIFIGLNKDFKDYRFFSAFKIFNRKYFIDILKTGIPVGSAYGIELGALLIITMLMGHFGNDVLAAYRISLQYLSIMIVALFAVSEATTTRVGYAVGKQNRSLAKLAAHANLIIGLFILAIFLVVIVGFTEPLINIDMNVHDIKNQWIVKYAKQFLIMVGIVQTFDCFRILKTGALRGLKDTKIPMIISAIGYWLIALPVGYFAAFIIHLNGLGLWIGVTTGIGTAALILHVRFRRLVEQVDFKALLV